MGIKHLNFKTVITAAVFAFAGFVLSSCGSTTVNLDDYLVISAEGYDGYGTLSAVIDWDGIEEKYDGKLKFADTDDAKLFKTLFGDNTIDALEAAVSIELAKDSNLSNGDSVAYTWKTDDVESILDCEVTATDGEYVVSGLTELAKFDAFADLEVSFEGIAPDGILNLNYLGTELALTDFSADTRAGLSNGDTVTVTVSESAVQRCIDTNGSAPEAVSKSYTVEGVSSYVESLSEISSEALDSMKKQAEDTWAANEASDWNDNTSATSFEYLGEYLLVSKDSETWSEHDRLILVYKAHVLISLDSGDDEFDLYWCAQFNDLTVSPDGEVDVDLTECTPTYKFHSNRRTGGAFDYTSFNGYETLDSLYKEKVTANIDKYNHEDNVTDSAASNSTDTQNTAEESTDEEEDSK